MSSGQGQTIRRVANGRHFSRHDRPPVISLLDGPAKETVTYAGPCSATEADFKVEASLSENFRKSEVLRIECEQQPHSAAVVVRATRNTTGELIRFSP